jgi:hypothetical protein
LANSKGIGCGGIIVVLIVAGVVSSWVSGGDSDSSTESASESETAQTFQSFGCLEVSETLVDSISQGFDGSTLTGRAAGFLASQYSDVRFVAVEFVPDGLSDPEVAVFATNDDDLSDISLNGLIIPVDGFAKEFSDWGEAPNLELSIADKGATESVECLSLTGYKLADPPGSQDSSSSIACEAALNGNERFVEVINGIQNNEMSTEVAAELSGEIEKSLDDAWETIDDPSFQSAMLEMANIIGLARMSLENGDLESYELMVDEFIVSDGYFRPYCE